MTRRPWLPTMSRAEANRLLARALAGQGPTPDELPLLALHLPNLMTAMATHPVRDVRLALARHRAFLTRPTLVDRLLTDPDDEVRMTASRIGVGPFTALRAMRHAGFDLGLPQTLAWWVKLSVVCVLTLGTRPDWRQPERDLRRGAELAARYGISVPPPG